MRGRLSRELCCEGGRCRWCGQPVPKGRRSWCSDGCVTAFQIEAWPSTARTAVAKRDHEVCRLCGRDCGRISRYIEAILANPLASHKKNWDYATERYIVTDPDPSLARRRKRWVNLLRRLKMTVSHPWDPKVVVRHYWEADHIVPVVRGGHNTLDNLRTLCRSCHRRETARLSRERAAERRQC